jgi:hypothetical protein
MYNGDKSRIWNHWKNKPTGFWPHDSLRKVADWLLANIKLIANLNLQSKKKWERDGALLIKLNERENYI